MAALNLQSFFIKTGVRFWRFTDFLEENTEVEFVRMKANL